MANLVLVRRNLRQLRVNDAVEIHDAVAPVADLVVCRPEHDTRILAAVPRIGVGKHLADVPEGGCAQQCIGDRVQQDVRIAVAGQMPVKRYVAPADPQRPAIHKPMGIKSNSDSVAGRDSPPSLMGTGRRRDRATRDLLRAANPSRSETYAAPSNFNPLPSRVCAAAGELQAGIITAVVQRDNAGVQAPKTGQREGGLDGPCEPRVRIESRGSSWYVPIRGLFALDRPCLC